MKTKPELGSNHLHGKHVGNQEDPTSCGSHHHPQKMFYVREKNHDVWNFTWEEQKPNNCESSQKAARQGPEKVDDQPFGQVWLHLNDNSNEEGRLASSFVWQPAKRVGADHHACHEERLDGRYRFFQTVGYSANMSETLLSTSWICICWYLDK